MNYELILGQLPGFVFWKDTSSTYMGANKAYKDLMELKDSSIEGKTDFDLPWHDFASIYRNSDIKTFDNKIFKNMDKTIINGKVFTCTIEKRAIIENNKVIGIVGQVMPVNHDDSNLADLPVLNHNVRDPIPVNRKTIRELFDAISLRESEVLYYFVRGKTMLQISELLGLAPCTIETHIKHMKTKWKVRTKEELVSRAISLGFMHCIPQNLLIKPAEVFQPENVSIEEVAVA